MNAVSIAIIAAAMLSVLLVAVLGAPARFTGFAAGLLILSAHTEFLGEAAGNGTRGVGLVLLTLFVLLNQRAERKPPAHLLFVLTWFGSLVYGLTFIASPEGILGLAAGGAFILSATLLGLLVGRDNFASLASSAINALACVTVVSVVMYAVVPTIAIHGGSRLRGVFANANTMGFFCALLLVLIFAGYPVVCRNAVALFSVSGLLLSGSRASLIAVLLASLVLASFYISRGHFLRVLYFLIGSAVFGGAVLYFSGTADMLFRTNNSRDTGEDYVFRYLDLKLFGGVGYGGELVEIASTPLRWLAQGGFFVAGLVVLAYLVLLVLASRIGSRTAALVIFGVVNSLFEGWYFAGVSGVFMYYWIAVFAISRTEFENDRVRAADEQKVDSVAEAPSLGPLVTSRKD